MLVSLSSVPSLFSRRGPSTISGRVIAIVVDAVKRVLLGRTCAHVGVERRETSAPSFADANPSSSVVSEPLAVWVFAPVNHVRPREVFVSAVHAMLAFVDSIRFGSIASARRRISDLKVVSRDAFFCAAVASAQPLESFARVSFCGRLQHQ